MKKKNKLTANFYQNLGKLFYAVAASDNSVTPLEIETLKKITKSEWLEIDSLEDEFGSDVAYQMEFVFDALHRETNLTVENCYYNFINYKNAQNHLFTEPIKQLILKTANAIASSFAGNNKSELILLAKLELELKKTDT